MNAVPIWPLTAMLGVQTLATAALFSVPTAAPEIARALALPGPLIGVFVSLVYCTGVVSAVLAPGFVWRFGPVRVSQVILLGVVAMLAIAAAGGSAWALGAGAVALGLGYGAAALAATHLLVPLTPRPVFNLVMSIRQMGVPLGGVLAALIVPPLVLGLGWQVALLAQIGPVLLLAALLQISRARWDAARDRTHPLLAGALRTPFRLLRHSRRLRILSVASFVFSGVQLCFVAFMTVQLTTIARFTLVDAGLVLALYQIAGAVSRPLWGWVADHVLTPSRTLAALGFGMAAACIATGLLGPGWPGLAVALTAVLGGATASGFTGVAYAEYAILGGERRTEATGLGTASMFFGVMLIPSAFGVGVTHWGGYLLPYAVLSTCACVSAAGLWSRGMTDERRPRSDGG